MSYSPTPADFQALVQLSAAQSPPIDPNQVALVLFEESGFNPASQGPAGASVYGLNQMSASNLSSLGLTPTTWTAMSAAQQLPYIFKWWDSLASGDNAGQFPSDGGMLLALNFLPGAFKTVGAGSNPSAVLAGANGPYASYYTANKVLDPNGTGSITVSTCRTYLSNVANSGGAAWAVIQAGILAAGGNSTAASPSSSSTPSTAGTAIKNAAIAAVGGVALGGAAHFLLPKPRLKKRRYT
jgi:hypothetical protein